MAVTVGQKRVSDLNSTSVLKLDVSKDVFLYSPGDTPFQSRLRQKGRTRPVKNLVGFKFNIMPEVTRTYTLTGSHATILPITSNTGLQVGDVVCVPTDGDVTGSGVKTLDARIVTGVSAGVSVTINASFVLAADGTTPVSLDSSDKIYRISASTEDGGLSRDSVLPVALTGNNNCQQIRKSIEVSNNEIIEAKYINPNALYRNIARNDFKVDLENAIMFGKGYSSVTGRSSNNTVSTMQGLYTAMLAPTDGTFPFQEGDENGFGIQSSTGFAFNGSDFAYEDLMDFLSDSMTYGSTEKDLYVDGWFSKYISAMNQSSFRTYKNEATLGMNVTEVVVPGKGMINVIYNPCFDKGLKFNGAILVDMEYVNLCIYRDSQVLVHIEENDRDGRKDEMMGTYSIEFGRQEAFGYMTHLLS